MASRRTLLTAGLLAVSFVVPMILPTDADARSSRRRNQAAEWEAERREEERHERSMKRQESWQKHRERQLDTWVGAVGGRGRRSGGGGSANGGQSCMYGAKGEVIHRPEGAVCKGDPTPAPASQAQSASSAPAKQTKGRCVYGKSGKLLWSEPGAEC